MSSSWSKLTSWPTQKRKYAEFKKGFKVSFSHILSQKDGSLLAGHSLKKVLLIIRNEMHLSLSQTLTHIQVMVLPPMCAHDGQKNRGEKTWT
jgi:hypothetical protein